VFCSAGGDIWRWLAFILPPVPCRKAVTIVDYSGTGAIISNIAVYESWRQGLNVYIRSATNPISLRSYCISQYFNLLAPELFF